MRTKTAIWSLVCSFVLAFTAASASGQLYTENFDDGNAVSRWTANPGIGFDNPITTAMPLDTNFDREPVFPDVDGINDDFSGFAFDYSIHGIPAAPNSNDPNTTIGLQLQTDLFSNRLGGFSASPNSLNLTGDYSIKFDYWGMAVGPFPFGATGGGTTMLSTFGLLTAGTTSQSILSADGVFFGAVVDAGSASDYRVYSAAATSSHQINNDPNSALFAVDNQATYHAGTRNGTGQLYLDAVGDPNGTLNTVPQSVIDAVELLYPSGDPNAPTMSGPLFSGAAGLEWREMEIRKVGNLIDWYMNGFKLITMDITDWSDPNNTITPGGGNISFGMNDTNFSSPTNPAAFELNYTLIDNIEVTAIVPVEDADFDDDGFVTGLDFLIWQRNIGTPDALNADGDANGDMMVNELDLAIWEGQYGAPPPVSAIAAVPEPSALVSWITMTLFSLFGYRPCRRAAR